MGTWFFYTVTHEGKDYTVEGGINGCAKVAKMLHVDKKRVRRGSNPRNQFLPDSVRIEMQCADQYPALAARYD